MIHAYDEQYLSCAQRGLASMLDYMVNGLQYPIETAWRFFLASSMCARFERGDCAIVAGHSGYELAYMVLKDADIAMPDGELTLSPGRSMEYWTGWAIARYQWETNQHFEEITRVIPILDIRMLYHPYHEMDIRQFIDRMQAMYLTARPDTNLKTRRLLAGLSQSELARRADIPVRTIQQYEQRQKDLNKAQGQALLRLAKALHCNIEDLLEMVEPDAASCRGSYLAEPVPQASRVAE